MRTRRMIACVVLVGTMSVPAFAQSAGDSAPIRRVRSEKPAIATLIEEGVARSETFKRLVATIDRTDGLVYIEEGKCGHSVRACLVLTVTVAGPYRMLRILIDPGGSQQRLISSIGHELQHAIEVLNEPRVRSNDAIFHFFLRTGPTARERFETPAATRTGLEVCAELGSDK